MDIGPLWNCAEIQWIINLDYLEKNDVVCYKLDDYTIDAWLVKKPITVKSFNKKTITANDFRKVLNLICNDIDKDILVANEYRFLPCYNNDPSMNLPDEYKTLYLLIKEYLIRNDGKIDKIRMTSLIDNLSDFNLRIYPTQSVIYTWIKGCFEFHKNDRVYKLEFDVS
jgi:hypothetical protein